MDETAENLEYASFNVGRKIRNVQTGEHAVITGAANAVIDIKIADGPDAGEEVAGLTPAELTTYWRKDNS